MTQDEVLATLHRVVAENMNYTTWTVSTPHLVELVNLAVEQEREACAKMCDNRVTAYQYATDVWAQEHIDEARHLAKAIRARGNT
jgi:hypothetical protein